MLSPGQHPEYWLLKEKWHNVNNRLEWNLYVWNEPKIRYAGVRKLYFRMTGCKLVHLMYVSKYLTNRLKKRLPVRMVWTGVMKITLYWDLFYHLESVANIRCRGIWCQVSGYGGYKLQIPDTWYLWTPQQNKTARIFQANFVSIFITPGLNWVSKMIILVNNNPAIDSREPEHWILNNQPYILERIKFKEML